MSFDKFFAKFLGWKQKSSNLSNSLESFDLRVQLLRIFYGIL